jgi:hypothetical protein
MEQDIATIASKDKPYGFSRIMRHMFTGKDNSTIDISRVTWAIGTFAFVLISAYFVWKTGQWNPLEWGTGFAAVSGGGGAAVKLKETAEPQ